MENFHQPELNHFTTASKAYDPLNLKLQEMLDRCVPEKTSGELKNHKNYGCTLCEQQKIVKNRGGTWKKYKQQHLCKAYTMKRNTYIWLLHYFKKQSIGKKVLDCKNDTKDSST